MRICGIVAEYNPFHRGHAHHIEQSRRLTGADIVVCAMSGSFVQRGEPAIFDKWTRAVCAIAGGADAVIELPLLSAIQSAEGFASGGIKQLAAAGITDLCFGCETDDMELLSGIADTVADEDEDFKLRLSQHLAEGKSFARARAGAAGMPDIAALPGAILGVEYLKAIRRGFPHIVPHAVLREGAAYHSDDISARLPSATAIRRALAEGKTQQALAAMPEPCADIVRRALSDGLVPVFPRAFDAALLHTLRLRGASYIAALPDVSEGLENRIYSAAQTCRTREALIQSVKTKRYAYARISRILLCALLGVTKEMVSAHNAAPAAYVRVLAVRDASVMSALADAASVPLITSAASVLYPDLDAAATGVWALSQTAPPYDRADRDFTQRLLI
jgi:predicted nucleotidyltransferase